MRKSLLAIGIAISWFHVMAGESLYHRDLNWKDLEITSGSDGSQFVRAGFPGARYDMTSSGLPIYTENFPLPANVSDAEAIIENEVYDVPPEEFSNIEGIDRVTDKLLINYSRVIDQKRPVLHCEFLPIRINPYNGQVEILVSFDLIVRFQEDSLQQQITRAQTTGNSVLASGNWYKLSVTQTGIHQLKYNDLQNMGIDPSKVDPRNIRIYGNGGGMLPESISELHGDDLAENSIYVSGESDGKFDQQDFILFYGESPNTWSYQAFSQAFIHEQNIYSDSTYYFLNFDLGPGKRVADIPQSSESPNVYVDKFTDYDYHERDLFNLANIGRVWYGEVFDVSTSYSFDYNFPNIDLSSPAYFRAYVAAKSEANTQFKIMNGSETIMTASINGIPSSTDIYARPYIGNSSFNPASSDINIRIDYEKNITSSLGWLNYFEINVIRNLIFSGSQMSFRDPVSVYPGNIAEFTIGNAGPEVQIWNVTDPTNVKRITTTQSGNNQVFRMPQDSLEEYIAYNGSSYLPVSFTGKVENQDLHGESPCDMVIITNPLFREQAERLADFHRVKDGLTVLVTDIGDVYNEFSSGAQDITAIRNFMKYLYDNADEGREPKYLLLFGDASFDYKNRIENNSNYVPTWEEEESLIVDYSIASDDYYGFLDGSGDDRLDIGIGRLPVQTQEQAKVAVDKIIHYATNTQAVMKDWRNVVCFVADDEDGNQHLTQAEDMAAFIDSNYAVYNIDKIYVDAFPQVSTPGGQRAPDVNRAIDNRIDKGCLIMNYTGHGGEVGWGHERFLENSDINSWTNYDRMPIFITATCEFSRYDDPERTSAGEYTFLNPHGGAVALFTTARATYGSSNFNLNTALLDYIFEKNNGEYYRFGDLIKLAKNDGGVNGNDKKFILLGDPALHLAYPENQVYTTMINGRDVEGNADTLQALKKITVEGEVRNGINGDLSFNGTVFPIVFDKPSQITTLATDQTSYQRSFNIQNNILYKGKAQVTDGKFSFTFIVPKDIAYQYGFGKISYYAANEVEDAQGYYNNIIVGGFNQATEPDTTGPDVQLFMNNAYFISGGITDENPDMLAFVHDDNGINTAGTGIGHDIVAVLDGNTEDPFIMNDFYESDLDSYSSGTIRYPFTNLSTGKHTLSLKVWDVFNNSSDAYIEFTVVSSEKFTINDLENYPNPFKSSTTFVFSSNQAEGTLKVMLSIYNLQGQMVRYIETEIVPTGYRCEPVEWDGTDQGGVTLAKGMYIYRMVVRNENGQADEESAKLILINSK
jgi:hypothetical protein